MQVFDPELLIAAACNRTGLDDFGDDDFREGLEHACTALSALPFLDSARELAATKIIGDLSSRLLITQWYASHPELANERIDGALLVTGLPRTGTTAMVGMLALDKRYRFPRLWEGNAPVPPPVLAEEHNDPRAIAARKVAALRNANMKWHIVDADGPEEDQLCFGGLNMRNLYAMYPMPGTYLRWWMDDDYRSTFVWFERVMKLLQSRRPPHFWLLKSPSHIFKLDALLDRFPDTKIVMTHRDPAKIIASMASVFQMTYDKSCGAGTIDKHWTGARALSMWQEGIARIMATRDRLGEDRFVDVNNTDVVNNPIGTFERLYGELGFDLDADLRSSLEDYHRRNAKGAHGSHDYTPEEYGLSEAGIRQAFKDYVDRFSL